MMPWIFLVWLLSFLVQCILLGISLFQLITLTDLEADYVNPYEASNRFNRLVIPEYAIQASIAILSTLTGNWLYGFLNLTLTAYHTHLLLKRQHLVDVTEIFRLVGMKRKQGSVKMVTYLVFFVWALYRLLGVGVRIYMTPEGRSAAKKVKYHQTFCKGSFRNNVVGVSPVLRMDSKLCTLARDKRGDPTSFIHNSRLQ